MSRALWKGAISFGLVHIPVELHPAEDRREFKFAMLDRRDFSPVGYKRYSKKSGKEVEWEDVVKGYEYAKDKYVVLSDEDFRRANVEATGTIDIAAFVPMGEIAPQFYESPYYLVPVERGQKVYALLRECLQSTKRVAVAQVVIRTVVHLVAVAAVDRALMLNTLRYADELRDTKGLELPPAGLKAAHLTSKEVELAKRLIEEMTERWKPEAFKNGYHRDLMRRIDEKIKRGETHVITEPGKEAAEQQRSAQVIDLASLLMRSLEKDGARAGKSSRRAASTNVAAKPAMRRAASRNVVAKPALRVVSGTAAASRSVAAKRKRA